MELSFDTPIAALVGLVLLVPLLAFFLRERRATDVRRVLGLRGPRWTSHLLAAFAALTVFGLLSAAAAEPVVRVDRDIATRADAEVFFVFDVSRSMLASASPDEPSRLDRARTLAPELRSSLSDVPAGIVSLTDRPLPHAFPTESGDVFHAIVTTVLGIENPPPAMPGERRATDFGSLRFLGTTNFFSARSAKRLAIVLTDGETRPLDAQQVGQTLSAEGVNLIFVRFWSPDERVFNDDGEPEAYRPDVSGAEILDELAERTFGQVFGEQESDQVAAAARDLLGEGPTTAPLVEQDRVAIGGYLALAAVLPLGLLLARRPGG